MTRSLDIVCHSPATGFMATYIGGSGWEAFYREVLSRSLERRPLRLATENLRHRAGVILLCAQGVLRAVASHACHGREIALGLSARD